MELTEILDFLEAPLVLELDKMRDTSHIQSFLVEKETITIEYSVLVITRDIAFGDFVVVDASIDAFEFSVDAQNVYEIDEFDMVGDLIYDKIERAVNNLME